MSNRLKLLTLVAVMAACSSSCSGNATDLPESETVDGTPAQSDPALPPRPEEIDLTGVDACTLLTVEQQHQLGTDMPPAASEDTDRYGNKYCDYGKDLSSPRFGFTLKVVTQEDATVYLSGERDVTARVVSAAGFPAVESRRPYDDRGCFVDVSTKDGQYLSVQYGESAGSNDSTEVACEKARVAAEMATQTLLTQR